MSDAALPTSVFAVCVGTGHCHLQETQTLLQDHAAAFEEWKQQQMQQLEADKAALAEEAAARRDAAATRFAARQHGGQDGDDDGGGEDLENAAEQAGEPVASAYEGMEDDDFAPAAEAAADEAGRTTALEQQGDPAMGGGSGLHQVHRLHAVLVQQETLFWTARGVGQKAIALLVCSSCCWVLTSF